MKKISINSNCNGCGICLMVTKYFFENEDGFAEIKKSLIDTADITQVENVVSKCPTKAIVVEEDAVNENDKPAAVKKIIKELEKTLDTISISRVNEKDMRLDIDTYKFPYPTSPNEITTDYRSELAAKYAAKEDFDRLVYGEAARNTLITKILVEQKVSTCGQYCIIEENERSFYYNQNKHVEKVLENSLSGLTSVLGKSFSLRNDWAEVHCFPKKDGLLYGFLNQFPHNSGFVESIWNYVRDLGPTTLSDYVDYMDFDYFETFAGFGLFDRVKTKKEWTFRDFRKATDEFYEDIRRAFRYESDDIAKYLAEMVNGIISDYEEQLNSILQKKIKDIKESVKGYL